MIPTFTRPQSGFMRTPISKISSEGMEKKKELTYKLINNYLNKTGIIKNSPDELDCINSEVLKIAPENFFDDFLVLAMEIAREIRVQTAKSNDVSIITKMSGPKNSITKEDIRKAYFLISKHFNLLENGRTEFSPRLMSMDLTDKKILFTMIYNEICGLGPIEPLIKDKKIKEIMCNGPYDIVIEDDNLIKIESCKFLDAEHLQNLINKIFSSVNKRSTKTMPLNKARLADKSRVFAVNQIVAPDGPNLNIRRQEENWVSPDKLIEWGAASPELLEWLGQRIHEGMRFIVNGGTSTGKSLDPKTPIPTPNGFVLLEDIKVGDYVFDETGCKTKVLNVFHNPNRKQYNVELNNNAIIGCDLEHNHKVYNGHQGGQIEVKTTQEILKNSLFKNGNAMFHIPKIVSPIIFDNQRKEDDFKIHPYLLGVYLAYQTLEKKNNDFELQSILGFSIAKYNNEVNNNFKFTKKDKETTVLENYTNFIKEFKKLNLEKGFPSIYEYSDIESRKNFLGGVLDLIGEISKNVPGVFIKSEDLDLLKTIQRIASSLGLFTKIKYNIKKGKETKHILSIVTFDCLFKTKAKIFNFKEGLYKFKNGKYDSFDFLSKVAINKIKETDEEKEMICLTVDSPYHTFLAGHEYNVTHNTTMLTSLCGFIPNNKRIITIEKNIEMRMPPNKMLAAAMETVDKSTSSDTSFEVTMRDLVEACTQMRPDTIICGEIVGPETYDLLQAANTGHQAATSIHSNTSDTCVPRLISLTSQSEMVKGEAALELVAAGIDLIITLERHKDDLSRRITNISEVGYKVNKTGVFPILDIHPIWVFEQDVMKPGQKKVTGKWVKVGELSKERSDLYKLDKKQLKTLEELRLLYS